MDKIYTELTDMLGKIPQDELGNWIIDRENDGTMDHPVQMPFVEYSELVRGFVTAVYRFEEEHSEYGLSGYIHILEKHDIEWGDKSMAAADVSDMDGQGVMALLMGAVRAERFCDGALLDFFENGCIQKWIERLKEIDNVKADKDI